MSWKLAKICIHLPPIPCRQFDMYFLEMLNGISSISQVVALNKCPGQFEIGFFNEPLRFAVCWNRSNVNLRYWLLILWKHPRDEIQNTFIIYRLYQRLFRFWTSNFYRAFQNKIRFNLKLSHPWSCLRDKITYFAVANYQNPSRQLHSLPSPKTSRDLSRNS